MDVLTDHITAAGHESYSKLEDPACCEAVRLD